MIVTAIIRSFEHYADSDCKSRLPPVQRYRSFLILACLLSLPGCSGCEKTTPETLAKPQEAVTPTVSPVPEVEVPTESTEIQSESEPDAGPSEKSTVSHKSANTVAGQVGAAPSNESKSSVADRNGSKVSAGPRAPSDSESSPSKDQPPPKTARKSKTAAEALETAASFQSLAGVAAAVGKYGRAFQFTSDAWEAAHAFPQDSACQALCKKLDAELELLAERANAVVEPVDAKTKKLVDQ